MQKKNLLKFATIGLASAGLVATPVVLTSCSKNENNPVDPTPTIESDKYALAIGMYDDNNMQSNLINYQYGKSEYDVSINNINTFKMQLNLWDKQTSTVIELRGAFNDHASCNAQYLDVQTDISGINLPNDASFQNIDVWLSNVDSSWIGKSLKFYVELSNSPDKGLGDVDKLAQTFKLNFVA